VMNYGIKQQMNHPQAVYDEPVNMFVAKFLGNPPINIIPAKIVGGQLTLLDNTVLEKGFEIADQEVMIGLRPEYFKIVSTGKITAQIEMIEHIGRDTMIICQLENAENTIRVIVPSAKNLTVNQKIKLNATKFFIFNKETGERYK